MADRQRIVLSGAGDEEVSFGVFALRNLIDVLSLAWNPSRRCSFRAKGPSTCLV